MTSPAPERVPRVGWRWTAVAVAAAIAVTAALLTLRMSADTVLGVTDPGAQPRPSITANAPKLNCLAAPSICGYPDATNTGVRPRVALSRVDGDVHSTREGQVIEGLDIRGTLYIDHSGVIVQNVKVTGAGGYSWAIWVGKDTPVDNVTIRDCTVDANRSDQGGVASGEVASWTMLRCNIRNGENAVRPAGNALIQDNYLHDFASSSPTPHFDGVEVYAGAGSRIVHNTIVLNRSDTSVVNVQAAFAPVRATTIENNLIQGGGWQLNIRSLDGPVTDTTILNNRFGEDRRYGYAALDVGTVGLVRGNVRDTTGETIDHEL